MALLDGNTNGSVTDGFFQTHRQDIQIGRAQVTYIMIGSIQVGKGCGGHCPVSIGRIGRAGLCSCPGKNGQYKKQQQDKIRIGSDVGYG